jgi:ATP-dependent helicase/nuclease subunit A
MLLQAIRHAILIQFMFESVMQTSPADLAAADQAARIRALEPHTSFIVDAPAGAGKTELLTQRFLVLLAQVAEPEEVVALTFTRKAAAEMRDRIMRSLRRATLTHDSDAPEHTRTTQRLARRVLEHDRQRGWQILSQPGRLRIMTLDALGMSLSRQMPLLSRFGSQPALSTECRPLYEKAARDTLHLLNSSNAIVDADCIARALAYFDNDVGRFQKMLISMLERRDQWQTQSFNTTHASLQQEVSRVLHGLVSNELTYIARQLEPVLRPEVIAAARHAATHSPDSPIHLLQHWHDALPTDASGLPYWRAVSTLFLTGNDLRKDYRSPINLAGPANKLQKETLKAALAEFADRALGPLLLRIKELPDPVLAADESDIVCDLSRVLQLASANLWLTFIREKTVDHTEIAQRALQALGEPEAPTDLAQQLDYQIHHLLVDEFQDTSPTQVRLLEKLIAGWTEETGQTLFLVGDPMQSIYRFRKADVGLFIRVRQKGIGHIQPEPLRLYQNYRSTSDIVDWVNQTFKHIFSDADDAVRGAVRFSPAVSYHDSAAGSGVHIHPILFGAASQDTISESDDSAESVNTREAQIILQLIRQTQAERPEATIAVLVRARSHLKPLITRLQKEPTAIAFQAVEIDPLAGRQPIQDLVSLTRALFHLGDRIHWLAILRAPWCGLRLEDLHHLAADDHEETIWRLMQAQDRINRLTPDGQRRLCRLRQIITDGLHARSLFRPRRWVESVWRSLGGHLTLNSLSDVADVEAYFRLLDQLEQNGIIVPDHLDEGLERLYAAPDTAPDSTRVQLMTIHKSKGLQFDTVIIPGLHKRLPTDDKPMLIWDTVLLDDDHEHLVVAPIAPVGSAPSPLPTPYDLLRQLEKTRSLNESQRVLYVGATRAERRLHLLGAVQRDPKPDADASLRPPVATSLLAQLWPTVETHFRDAAHEMLIPWADLGSPNPVSTSRTLNTADFTPRLVRLNEANTMPVSSRDPTESVTSLSNGGNAVETTLEMSIGTMTHRYLEAIAHDGLDHWSTYRIVSLRETMARAFQQQGHSQQHGSMAADSVIQALSQTLNSQIGCWILEAHDEAACEMPMSSPNRDLPGTFSHHVIDRVFIDEGVRWIIDYKIGLEDTSLTEAQLQSKALSYQSQLERYASLFKGDPIKTRTAIFFPARGKLIELPISTEEG